MKKTYIQPAIELVKTNVEVMLTGSGELQKSGSTTETSGNLVKGRGGIFGSNEAEDNDNGIW